MIHSTEILSVILVRQSLEQLVETGGAAGFSSVLSMSRGSRTD